MRADGVTGHALPTGSDRSHTHGTGTGTGGGGCGVPSSRADGAPGGGGVAAGATRQDTLPGPSVADPLRWRQTAGTRLSHHTQR